MQTRYVNTASSAGGDGTTNGTAGSTRAFASLREALDSLPATLTDAYTINCSGSAADTLSVTQGHWDFATTSSNYILLQGENTSGKWDTSKYRLEVTNDTGIYNSAAGHVRIDKFQVMVTQNDSVNYECIRLCTANNQNQPVDHRISNTIVRATITGGTNHIAGFGNSDPVDNAGGTCRLWNCIAYDCQTGFASDATSWDAANLINYNCTAWGNNSNWADDQKCINCLSDNALLGDGAGFNGTGTTGHSNNASGDSSAGGTNARTNQTFTFVNTASRDFHLQSSDAGAKDHGLTDPGSGLFSDDIDGQTRSGTWDIGADEVLSSSSSVSPSVSRSPSPSASVSPSASLSPSASQSPSASISPSPANITIMERVVFDYTD